MFLQSTQTRSGSFLGSMEERALADGDLGIHQTVQEMKVQVVLAKEQPEVRRIVSSLIDPLRGTSQKEKSKALVKWFMANMKYKHDDDLSDTEDGIKELNIKQCPKYYKHCHPVEIISSALRILKQRYDDCDGFSMFLSAMHQLAGIETCYVIVALDPTSPLQFSHIYLRANLDGSWIPVDAVNASQPWNWEAEKPFRREIIC